MTGKKILRILFIGIISSVTGYSWAYVISHPYEITGEANGFWVVWWSVSSLLIVLVALAFFLHWLFLTED
jgi:hypothetical protein